MKQCLFLFLFLLSIIKVQAQETSKPNILFIAIDDLKPTIGSYGDQLAITPNIEVGTTSDPDLVCDSPSNDLTETNGRFMCFPEYTHPESSANDLTIKARCWHYGSTAGSVTVKISYI